MERRIQEIDNSGMAASSFRHVFSSGFATGSVASLTLYTLYSYFTQPQMKQDDSVQAQSAAQVQVKGNNKFYQLGEMISLYMYN